jgi:ATP-binding cassette subfamily F protein 2
MARNQMKKYSKEQVDIAKMKEYVARFSHGSRKLAKQGKSKEKLLNKRLIKNESTKKMLRTS